MTYIALACEKLSYRDKLRLAQLLIQTARKEEENANPQNRSKSEVSATKSPTITDKQTSGEIDIITYVLERLLKLKPSKKKTLVNSIKSMLQFQGGISDSDIDNIINELQQRRHIKIEQNSISYL